MTSANLSPAFLGICQVKVSLEPVMTKTCLLATILALAALAGVCGDPHMARCADQLCQGEWATQMEAKQIH